MSVIAVALQLAATFGDVEGNRTRLVEAVHSLAGDIDLIVTPELCTTGYDLGGLTTLGEQLAEPLDGPTITLAAQLAATRHCTLVIGLLERGEDGALYDTAVIVRPDSSTVPYRKTHLYPPEHARFTAGDALFTVPTPAGRLGPLICFEHAFPEVATALALDGAQVLTIPSAVPDGYEHLLPVRNRARAQDNQVFVVACNLAGDGFCGRSLIVDPRGHVLAEAGTQPAALRATLDLDVIERERQREPALQLRRPELYRGAAAGKPDYTRRGSPLKAHGTDQSSDSD
jgi:predicted amidohydrolase